jgi:tetratricopeptide (TPR) repeat protein
VRGSLAQRFLLTVILAAVLLLPGLAIASERAVVLPLQPAQGTEYDGLGPAVLNVIENLLALHPACEETYLLRHMRIPFPTAGDLQSYILGKRPPQEPLAGLVREGARYVLGGSILPGLRAEVWVADLTTGKSFVSVLPIDANGGLLALRQGVIELLGKMDGLALAPAQAAKMLTPDKTTSEALRIFGRSYGSYLVFSHLGNRSSLDLALSKRAVEVAPQSYLAANMHGWMLYASRKREEAVQFFRDALKLDPNGVDALDGMVQTALRQGGADAALPWTLRKARTRGADTGPGLSAMHMVLGNAASNDKHKSEAAWHFRKAAALDPEAEQPPMSLALALHALGKDAPSMSALDTRLNRPASPAVRSILLNFKARMLRWTAQEHRKQGKDLEEKQVLELAYASLKASPFPDLNELSLTLQRLAQIAVARQDYISAAKFMESIQPEKGTDPLLVDTMLTFFRMQTAENSDAKEHVRICLNAVAERMRTHEPVPQTVYRLLAKTFEMLGEEKLAESMKRRTEELTPQKADQS